MNDLFGVLLPILMFALPVTAAIIDKKMKKSRATPSSPSSDSSGPKSPKGRGLVVSNPLDWKEVIRELGKALEGEAKEAEPLSVEPDDEPVIFDEAPHALSHKEQPVASSFSGKPEEPVDSTVEEADAYGDKGLVARMTKEEKRKLILYSEILRPKFDD